MDKGCDRSCVVAPNLLIGSIAIGCIAALVFSIYPSLDLQIAEKFHTTGRHFIGTTSEAVESIRQLFNALFIAVCAIAVLGCYLSHLRGAWSGLKLREWSFVIICILAGPLIVTNLGFKNHWGRARPRDVVELGGRHAYTPPLQPAHECRRNCSFVSGEASSIFAVGFTAAILFPLEAPLLLPLAIALGCLAGLVRMIQGGHFLSDVIFAGIVNAMATSLVFLAMQKFRAMTVKPLMQREKRERRNGASAADTIAVVRSNPKLD